MAQDATSFFEGSSDVIFTFSGHAMLVEVMFAMEEPAKFGRAFCYQWLYVMLCLTIPHSVAMWWAFGAESLRHHNALALMPRSGARTVAAILMVLHELVACGLFILPLFIMAEKAARLHHRSLWLKLPVRLLVFGAAWLVAVAFPFFGPMNGAIGALLSSQATYIVPCAAHLWVYRTAKARDECPLQPWAPKVMWPLMLAVDAFVVVFTAVIGFGFGSYYAIKDLAEDAHTFGVFETCYQCYRNTSNTTA